MKLIANKDALLEGLQKTVSVVPTRSTIPVLNNVYMRAEQERLWLTATDLEMTVQTCVDARVERSGGTTLPARRSLVVFRELPANDIEIDVNDQDVAMVRAGAAQFKIIGISEEEFPPVQRLQSAKSFVIEQKLLREMLVLVHYAASKEDTRPTMKGVAMNLSKGKISALATDGRRLALWEDDLQTPTEAEGEWIIPSRAVDELMALLRDEDSPVRVQASSTQISFEFDRVLFMTKLIDGHFPNVRHVIPAGMDERIVLEREPFMAAVHRVSLSLKEGMGTILLNLTKNNLEISAASADFGEARERMAVKYNGKDITIALSAQFLLNPLKAMQSDEVTLELSDDKSPCLIKNDRPFVYVLMPVRLK